ncbi:MAG: gluconate 2-dehydrogenase subunit 3 family protein [Acidobacteria bacterium]|nr:MAG: gluconate 2-dehydrogenase subunit 3 family protein [Acidobacteriota bacterium]REJ99380.1 MAG: gluconate 2-dehydrogenase subunit 3 family protein [Acidobacteriota bacterium]
MSSEDCSIDGEGSGAMSHDELEVGETSPTRRRLLVLLAGAAPVLGLPGHELLAIGHRVHARAQVSARRSVDRWKVFGGAQRATLAALADTILPETDTPSASQAGVVEFIDLLVADWFPDDARADFLARLDGFERRIEEERGVAFAELDEDGRREVVAMAESEALEQRGGGSVRTAPTSLAGQHLFDLVKWMTVWGYYTSEEGMRQERGYRVVPGRYLPDVPYEGIG